MPALGEQRMRRDDRYACHRVRLNVSTRRTYADTVDVDGEDVLGPNVALARGVAKSISGNVALSREPAAHPARSLPASVNTEDPPAADGRAS